MSFAIRKVTEKKRREETIVSILNSTRRKFIRRCVGEPIGELMGGPIEEPIGGPIGKPIGGPIGVSLGRPIGKLNGGPHRPIPIIQVKMVDRRTLNV